MNKTTRFLAVPFVFGAFAAGAVSAQETAGCPQLPADSGLNWEHRATGPADFCRALDVDGNEAFGIYISANPAFEPKRVNREEAGRINGREVSWYKSELAGKPDVLARETLLELNDGRSAHIWLQANSGDQLQQMFQLTQGLDFSPPRQADSNAIAAGQ